MNGMNRGGFNMGNMQSLLKQAQKMQEDMAKTRAEIDETQFEGSASGLVSVTLFGNKKLKSIHISKNAVDAEDLEMLEDLIVAAHNDAIAKIESEEKAKLPQLPAGM